MKYTEAASIGMQRVDEAVELLKSITRYARPAFFLKPLADKGYQPVGEENFFAIKAIGDNVFSIVICDEEGNAKAISQPMTKYVMDRFVTKLREKGLKEFKGELNYPE
jgi:hypothetical protein